MTGQDLDRRTARALQQRFARAHDLGSSGHHRASIAAVRELREALVALRTGGPLTHRFLGGCSQLEGQGHFAEGRRETAYECYGDAQDFFARDKHNHDLLVRLLHDVAMTLVEAGAFERALIVLKKAQEQARTLLTAEQYVEIVDLIDAVAARTGDARLSDESLDREIAGIRKRLRSPLRRGLQRAIDEGNLAVHLLNSGTDAELGEAQRLLLSALRAFRKRREWDLYVGGLRGMLSVLRRTFVFNGLLVREILHEGLAVAADLDLPRGADVAEIAAAVLHAGEVEARREDALNLALLALSLREIDGAMTRSTLVRGLSEQMADFARFIALTQAALRGDDALFVELLEGARLQVVPLERTPGPTHPAAAADNVGHRLACGSRVVLSQVHPIAVGPSSTMRQHLPDSFERVAAADVHLEDVIDAVGGKSSWWWGATLIDARYFWAVRSPQGEFHTGHHDLSEDEWTLVVGALAGMQDNATVGSSSATAFRCDPDAEERLSTLLGDLLIPAVLRTGLFTGPPSPSVPSLVVASNILAGLPTCLLGMRHTDGRFERVIERAVVRWAPPAAIVNRLPVHRPAGAELYPVTIACLDPDGSLDHASSVAVHARTTLRNSTKIRPGSRDLPATRSNLTTALRAMTPSQPATLLFSGHSKVGSGGLNSPMKLEDGVLTAEDILFGPDDSGPLPMPQRVLLSSCESAGSGGQGRGEWLGLSAAILLRGARQVLATGWSITEGAATKRLEEELVAGLELGEDPAETLRRSQLLRLALWRLTGTETAGTPDEDVERPLTWAAFQAIGVRS